MLQTSGVPRPDYEQLRAPPSPSTPALQCRPPAQVTMELPPHSAQTRFPRTGSTRRPPFVVWWNFDHRAFLPNRVGREGA